MTDLSGLNAVVTGCTGGIGTAISKALASAGATIIGADIAKAEASDAWLTALIGEGRQARYHHLDVTSESDWTGLMASVDAKFGRLDILVHNAGVVVVKTLEETTLADMRFLQSVNVEGVFLGTKAALSLLRKSGEQREFGASMVTISSVAGMIGAPLHVGYCMSKGAVKMFSKACAMEFSARKFNIRCNTVHPGGVETPMVDHIMQQFVAHGFAASVEAARAATIASHPIGRMAQPHDVAKAVRFLASDESGNMQGAELVIDGGMTAQ